MSIAHHLRITPGDKVRLDKFKTDATPGVGPRDEAEAAFPALVTRLADLVQTLWADNRYSLLIVLQGMDACGKDGTVRKVFSGVNPMGCRVTAFKKPTPEELSHDYLWRIHAACPRRGQVGIFNRSHYEDVGIVRVHSLVPKSVWSKRYDQINDFERLLHDTNTRILKFFIHISRAEQKERLLERIHDPLKAWKMELGDIAEREHWDEYMDAYSDALSRCSTDHAPWHVVPGDKKWYRNTAIASTVIETLESLDLRPQPATFDPKAVSVPD